MRFLVDECTGPAVASWLRQQNHEVFSVYEQARGAVVRPDPSTGPDLEPGASGSSTRSISPPAAPRRRSHPAPCTHPLPLEYAAFLRL
jgi:hypothetical protein